MPRIKRSWNQDFQKYMEEIVNHPNYYGLPSEIKRDGSVEWFAFANGKIRQARKVWAENKAVGFGFDIKPGVYALVMREIHPTKIHVCQTCGSSMSIYYHYPSANFVKALKKAFSLEFSDCEHISDIWEQILESSVTLDDLQLFLKNKFNLSDIHDKTKDEIIHLCEKACRLGGKKHLSPGVMSNFPDRFDGFHSYNRCCREEQDTGRSKDNLKSYTKDRRAYELWCDGNIHAANMFMGSKFFSGRSADHIGAISLGFVHDPRYLRPMSSSDNSTKRDRLLVEDIETIISVEEKTMVYPMSWYSGTIWEYIKQNYNQNKEAVPTLYRNMLKQNVLNYLFILKTIVDNADTKGRDFLIEILIKPKYECFFHSYEFDEDGNIISQSPRHFTERSNNEINRYIRIAFDALDDFDDKDNRRSMQDLTESEIVELRYLCENITKLDSAVCYNQLKRLVRTIENRLIQTMSSV